MTKVKMPDAVAHMTPSGSRVLTDREARSMQVAGWDRNKHLEYYSVPLISVADAEAYADARVEKLSLENHELRKDANRYTLLKENSMLATTLGVKDVCINDADIDAAIKEQLE